uniref:ubiquitinyl hydrolase 1 n=1 Tax=Globisporangium ultimum (strain ATCC 200006 / CBS 805.95 / DAOM BR144) TaxID=431595 RepID=K3W991_GLOUD
MNSCLQCVSNIPALTKYFQSGMHAKEINDASPTKGALAAAFGELIKTLWSNEQFTATRPIELKRVIGKVASRFTGYDQQDAQEFLRFLLDGLHEDLNKVKNKPPYYEIKDRDDAHVKDREVSDEYWKFYLERNASALSELFCGQLRSEIRCATCHHRSICFDVFWDLSLPVPKKPKSSSAYGSHHLRIANVFSSSKQPNSSSNSIDSNYSSSAASMASSSNGCSIEDCLKAYTDQEFLRESDAYYCAKCKTHRAVSKKIALYRLPPVLVIHLKRFTYSTFSRDKVSTAIQFPAYALDVAPYCASDAVVEGSTLYDLTGVVHHVGTLNGGHYTAECQNHDNGDWYDFNDASVSLVKKPQLSSSSAYILFFQRRDEKSITI